MDTAAGRGGGAPHPTAVTSDGVTEAAAAPDASDEATGRHPASSRSHTTVHSGQYNRSFFDACWKELSLKKILLLFAYCHSPFIITASENSYKFYKLPTW